MTLRKLGISVAFMCLVLACSFLIGCWWFQANRTAPVESQAQTPQPTPEKQGFIARVVVIHDGDTITVLKEDKQPVKLRLATIDAPEYTQSFGKASSKSLRELVGKKEVRVIPGYHDKYGRLIAVVMLGDMDINLEQIRRGFAWHYKQHQKDQSEENRRLYAEAEDAARNGKLGLWSEANPKTPWEYRNEEKANKFNGERPIKFNESSAADGGEY